MPNQPVIFSGDLSRIELPDVLSFVSMTRLGGELIVRNKTLNRTLYWKNGEIIFARSSSVEHELGQFLLRNGKITQEQYDESQRRMEPGSRHGKVLVQLGYLSPKDLWWGVKAHVLEIIFSLFGWKEGNFALRESVTELDEKITLQINTSMLIMEGIRRLDESARIDERITSDEMIFGRVPGAEGEIGSLEMGETELRIWELIDGERSVRDLVRQSGKMTEFEVKQLLYQMLSARLIDEVVIKESKPVFLDVEDSPDLLRVISVYNDMFERLYRELHESVGEDKARDVFATVTGEAETDSVLEGVFFDQFGRFDENMLVANISEKPLEERKLALDNGLNNLLSMQLFEVSQHLPAEKKTELFSFIEGRKNEIEGIQVG